nr:hypothetical protein [Tanacetum cinerariifolium]
MALWKSHREDHTFDWLRTVSISGLGQTMNGDIYGDHAVSCTGIIGIKHHRNVVCDTLVNICYRSGILADLTGSSNLTQTGMVDFVFGRAVIDDAQRKRVIIWISVWLLDMGFFYFLLFLGGVRGRRGRLTKADVDSGNWGTCDCSYFNRINFAIAKGV